MQSNFLSINMKLSSGLKKCDLYNVDLNLLQQIMWYIMVKKTPLWEGHPQFPVEVHLFPLKTYQFIYILHLRTWKSECFDEMIPKFCTNKGSSFISRNFFTIFMRPVLFSKLRKFQRIFVCFYSQRVMILIFMFKLHFLLENKFKCALRELHTSRITQKSE